MFYQQEITKEELDIESNVKKGLQKAGEKLDTSVSLDSIWGLTMHHLNDLDYNPLEYLPHIYGKFRERNAYVKVRPVVAPPAKKELPFPPKDGAIIEKHADYMPTLKDFGFSDAQVA